MIADRSLEDTGSAEIILRGAARTSGAGVSSGSPEEPILRPNRKDVATIFAVMALPKRPCHAEAKRAVEAMIANGDAIIPEVSRLRRRAMRVRFERL